MSFSFCLHQAHPQCHCFVPITLPLLWPLCSISLWLQLFLLSHSLSLALFPQFLILPELCFLHPLLVLSWLLPCPFLSGSFYSYLASSDQRWEILRSGGRVDGQGRWGSPMGYASAYSSLYLPVNTYLVPILMYIWIIIYLINTFLSNIHNT
jgi:hypothetical protein